MIRCMSCGIISSLSNLTGRWVAFIFSHMARLTCICIVKTREQIDCKSKTSCLRFTCHQVFFTNGLATMHSCRVFHLYQMHHSSFRKMEMMDLFEELLLAHLCCPLRIYIINDIVFSGRSTSQWCYSRGFFSNLFANLPLFFYHAGEHDLTCW